MLKRSTPAIADDTNNAISVYTALVWCRLALSTCSTCTLRSSPCHPATPDLHDFFDLVQFKLKLPRKWGSQWDCSKHRTTSMTHGELSSIFISIRFTNQKFRSELHNVVNKAAFSGASKHSTFYGASSNFYKRYPLVC